MSSGIHRQPSVDRAFPHSCLCAPSLLSEAELTHGSVEPIVWGGSDAMCPGPKSLEVASAFVPQRNLSCDVRSLATSLVEKERPSDHMGNIRASHLHIPYELSLAAVPEKVPDEWVSHLEHSNPAKIPHDCKHSCSQPSRIWPTHRIMGRNKMVV